MDSEDQIYVKYGDMVVLNVEQLQGCVSSQGFSNRNVHLQINPSTHQECFVRNKRDQCFQVLPRLVYDARKDYTFALNFFERNFGELKSNPIGAEEGGEDNGGGKEEGKEEIEEEGNEVKNQDEQAELVGTDTGEVANSQSGNSNMSIQMKKDMDLYKKKIQVFEKKLADEQKQNSMNMKQKNGQIVDYGNIIQLLHVPSQCFLQATKVCADEDNSCNKIDLGEQGSKCAHFKAVGGFKYKQEGDRIHYNDQIVLQSMKQSAMYLHVTERLLKIEGLEGAVPKHLKEGVDKITPKPVDRRDPPNHYVPQCEVNLGSSKTKFQIQIYRYYNENQDDQFIMCGTYIRLLHSERGGYLHSDDKDFTDDGQAEVYLWNFKGKQGELESQSSSSLFEIELATPYEDKIEDDQVNSGQPKEKTGQIEVKRQDPEKRIGKVMRYSQQGGIAQKKMDSGNYEEVNYRLRHLNTGRLVVDQEIAYNGVSMITLGLAPHLQYKNISRYSEQGTENIQADMMKLDNAEEFAQYDKEGRMQVKSDGTFESYKDLDSKSRFRIISTSPCLDDRIKANSCVQIQHVQSEMFLSYDTKALFKFNARKHKNQSGIQDSTLNNTKLMGEKLFNEVDDEDITSGSRDAIELKPARSNEDAFFILPEGTAMVESILFIQTAIDLLKKYLPTICSRTLEISKDKQQKIFEVLNRIDDFLLGDTKTPGHQIVNENLSSGFSKEENDMEQRKKDDMKIRQKLMRELYFVESLIHIIFLPFECGECQLSQVCSTDKIVMVCKRAYNLIKTIGYGYYQNELYVSQWINLYFDHAMNTNAQNNIGAEETIISLVDNNKKLLEMQITPGIIEKIVALCKEQERNKQMIQLLKAICSCHGQPIVNNQNDIVEILLEDETHRSYLMMPVRMKNDGSADVLMDEEGYVKENAGDSWPWVSTRDYPTMKKKIYEYFKSLIDLSAELCLGRNGKALENLQDMYNFDTVKIIVKDVELPYSVRALFMRMLLNMHMDREPLEPIQIPSQTGVWNDLPHFVKDQFEGPTSIQYPIKQAKISVPSSLSALKKFVENYLHGTCGVQNIFEVGKNMMTLEILKIIKFMLNHGFYMSLRELKEVSIPMINLLNGSNDIYFIADSDEQDQDENLDEFLGIKRYFSSGSNDIIVQSKSIICEILLIISQLEIDGKVQIFLSKFKSDLDMLLLQKQMNVAVQAKEDNEKLMGKGVSQKKGCFSCFKFNIGDIIDDAPKQLTFKQLENDNIAFLETIALSYNFEAQNQDAYICVLFDLLLYKYPQLAKGVFELLVRLFTRKRTILENLIRIQMLENPRSIKVLTQFTKYHKELKLKMADADTWLNKTNEVTKKIKLRVTAIFRFFTGICEERPAFQHEDEEIQEEEEDNDISHLNSVKGSDLDRFNEPDGEEQLMDAEEDMTNKSGKKKNNKVSIADFLLFKQKTNQFVNKENQRLLGNFEIENLAMFFIKFRVDRACVNDPQYQQLIYQCYNFLVAYVRHNLANQLKVHDNIEIFLRDIDKNPLISLLIYQMFKDNKKFLTLNVSKILRHIILSAEQASLQSSKKALYLKLLEVFCKHEDKLVRPNQQEIVINFTRDISKNNLIYLFSTEGLPHLIKFIRECIPAKLQEDAAQKRAKEQDVDALVAELVDENGKESGKMSIEVFNVIVCLNLMSLCCEGKSDLAEIKCQNDIMDMQVSVGLYKETGKFWPFKSAIVSYVTNLYLDSANSSLFNTKVNQGNVDLLFEFISLIAADLNYIHDMWHNTEDDYKILMPDATVSSFQKESKVFAMEAVCKFFYALLKNKKIDLVIDVFPIFHEITTKIAKLYYETKSEYLKQNAMDVLCFINNSEKYSHLLENVQHPANQNIYIASNKKNQGFNVNDEAGQKTSQFSAKLNQLAYSEDMIEQKEREFEALVLWVTNIDLRINNIMEHQAKISGDDFNMNSFRNVRYNAIVSSFMSLLDSKCLSKDLHITGLTLLRKIIEVDNKEITSPSADWEDEEWSDYTEIINAKQNSLVEIGCVEFLCKHLQEVEDSAILEQTFLVCITLLLGGNEQSQSSFFKYFQYQDYSNIIMMKLKKLLTDEFNHTKKHIGEKNAKLAMIYKVKQRKASLAEQEEQVEEEKIETKIEKKSLLGSLIKAPLNQFQDFGEKVSARGFENELVQLDEEEKSLEENDENLLTFDESIQQDQEEGDGGNSDIPKDEMFLLNQLKSQSIIRCMRLLRFIQLLTEGHYTNLQNFLREQTLPNGVVNQKSFDFVSNVAQMLAMYEKQYINCNSCQLGMQLINTLIEVVQGPCKLNQKRLVEAKIIDCCRDLIQQGQQSQYELEVKGFLTPKQLEQHDMLKMSSIKLLLSIIEGPVDIEIYKQIADSLDDFQILIHRMEIIYEKFTHEDLGLPEQCTLKQINDVLDKDSFSSNVTEGFDIFCLINQLAIALTDVKQKIKSFEATVIYQFFLENTGNVEVQKEGEIMTIYFPIQPITHYLTEKTKDNFEENVDRESPQHKILDLIARTPAFIDEMTHLERRSHDFIRITPKKLAFFRNFSTLLSIGISLIVLFFYEYGYKERPDGKFDKTALIDELPQQFMVYLGYFQLGTSFTLLLGTYMNKSDIIIKTGWRQKQRENTVELASDIKYCLNPLKPAFGDLKVKDLPLQAARIQLLTEGPYSSVFKTEGDLYDYYYTAIDFEQKWINMSFIMQNSEFLFAVVYLAFSVQGSIQSPIFYSFHLTDVVNRFPELQSVIQSVTLNGDQLLMTAMLGVMIIYIYSAIAFIFVYDTYFDDNISGGLLNRMGDSICMNMMHCFLSTVNYGVRGGGGIGENLPTQTAVKENIQGFYFRAVFDLTFFLIVITILLNIIFGIIIDTFAQLRDAAENKFNDIKYNCFICGIDRPVLERDTEQGFSHHIENDHSVWQYINFIIHLQSIEPSELNGTESYILDLFQQLDHTWFPMGMSQKINMRSDAIQKEKLATKRAMQGIVVDDDDEVNEVEIVDQIPIALSDIQEKIGDLAKKI